MAPIKSPNLDITMGPNVANLGVPIDPKLFLEAVTKKIPKVSSRVILRLPNVIQVYKRDSTNWSYTLARQTTLANPEINFCG